MATFRKAARQRIHRRIRKKVAGTAERPRLAVHFSGKHIYAQVIDDDAGRTIAAASRNVHLRRNSIALFLIAADFFTTEK